MTARRKRQKSRLEKDARIVIVGSGLGGLGAALSLEMAGFTNIHIVERDESVSSRREGYGLTITYNPKGPLAQMGILEDVAERDCPSRSHYVFAPDGSVLGYFGNAFSPDRGMGQRGNLRIPRQQLRQILLERVRSPLSFGKKLIDFIVQKEDQSSSNNNQLELRFQDGTRESNVDLLVGADGIRSAVVRSLLPDDTGLRYLGVFVVLGIANFFHPLLDERGFYTLDGSSRLFTMPYEGSNSLDGYDKQRRIMWQFSFRLDHEEKAKALGSCAAEGLRDIVLTGCKDWHDPVADMIQSTPIDTIWGTGLMDRDPEDLVRSLADGHPRVVVLGDAAHPMSPFKGQGANQALMDGPLLASWLGGRASFGSARKGFLREMAQRSAIKVRQSREAAAQLHTAQTQTYGFCGVPQPALLAALRENRIGAWDAHQLDRRVQHTIQEEQFMAHTTKEEANDVGQGVAESQALSFASDGRTAELRSLSLHHAKEIRSARDEHGRSCLHLAVVREHYPTCRWLLMEVFAPWDIRDGVSKTPLDYSRSCKDERIATLLEKHAKQKE